MGRCFRWAGSSAPHVHLETQVLSMLLLYSSYGLVLISMVKLSVLWVQLIGKEHGELNVLHNTSHILLAGN